MSNISKTDWERVDALTDEQIDTSDIPPLEEKFVANAKLRVPSKTVSISVNIDSETLSWYQSQGELCETRMVAALRIYAQAHKIAA